ncbi:hypothetical protein CK203_110438 [Vitis vinifera]|uniref:Uncharacterized protein n=1 Tax=Vitis vinifera TaxID=29760 RepID=A0A438BN87_VITVI|nr:hypothetical protein CK203_110438 [Vitis vinifera]
MCRLITKDRGLRRGNRAVAAPMAATGLFLSLGSPTGSDFKPSSKKEDPPTMLTLSLPRTETYENEYESPPLDSTPRDNKVASPDNQPALTFAMPENPEPMTFGTDFSLWCKTVIKTEVRNYMSGLEINGICS